MNAIKFYRHETATDAVLEYNFYDHKFAPTNLVVRKVLMAMLHSVQNRLTDLEVEYNDNMLVEKVGGNAARILTLLGASTENVQNNYRGETVVSRTFTAKMTPERFQYFYELKDVGELSRFALKEQELDRIVSYFNQYLLVVIPLEEEKQFFELLGAMHVPYQIQAVQK
ncbi:hypothetical protein [Brevibacillus laterosporus]|uniref:hypothetical protein n=1 Tax=Brevibacillus laterosporus TaxID=1465 RepID=UPI000839D16C|nr:hypothetical protein [Brevibacillus laterosporus]